MQYVKINDSFFFEFLLFTKKCCGVSKGKKNGSQAVPPWVYKEKKKQWKAIIG